MLLHRKNISVVFLFIIITNIATYVSAQDTICNLLILIDNNDTEKDDPYGPLLTNLTQAIYSQCTPIIVSGYILQRYFKNMSMSEERYKERKDRTFEEKWLGPGLWMFREPEMQLTSNRWSVYKKNHNLFVIIPKKYLASKKKKTIQEIGLDISGCTDVTKTIDSFCKYTWKYSPDESAFKLKYPEVLKPPKAPALVNIDDIKSLLIPGESPDKYDPKKERLLWVIYLDGHGNFAKLSDQDEKHYEHLTNTMNVLLNALESVKKSGQPYQHIKEDKIIEIDQQTLEEQIAKTQIALNKISIPAKNALIAGLRFDDFEQLFKIFNTHIHTKFLYYITCYAGGYNRAFVHEMLNNIQVQFIVAAGAITDKVAYSDTWPLWRLKSKKDEPLEFGFHADIKKYFDTLEKYFTIELTEEALEQHAQKNVTLEKALQYASWLDVKNNEDWMIAWTNDAPFVRIPNGDTFSAVNLDDKIYQLTNVRAKKHALEQTPFDLSDKKAVFLYAPFITVPVTINNACIFSMISPPIKKRRLYVPKVFTASHYFGKFSSKIRKIEPLDEVIKVVLQSDHGPYAANPKPTHWKFYYITVPTIVCENYENSGIESKDPWIRLENITLELRKKTNGTMFAIKFVCNDQGYFYRSDKLEFKPEANIRFMYKKIEKQQALEAFDKIKGKFPGKTMHKELEGMGGMLNYDLIDKRIANSFYQALAYNFFIGLGASPKLFLIEEFNCKNLYPITHVIINAARPGNASIKWIEDGKGYEKRFYFEKETQKKQWWKNRTLKSGISVDIYNIMKAIRKTGTTEISKEYIEQEFARLKKSIQPEEIDQKIAFSIAFLQKLKNRAQQNPDPLEKLVYNLQKLRDTLSTLTKTLEQVKS